MNAGRQSPAVSRSPSTEEVVEAAAALLEDGGASAVSMRRVAERLGVSRQIVYTRFGGKAGLIRAMHDEGFRRLSRRVEGVGADVDPGERLIRLALAYRAAAVESPALFEVMFGHPIPEFEPDREAVRVAETAFEPIAEAAGDWLQRDSAEDGRPDPTALARMCWSTTHGVVALELAGHTPTDPEQEIRELISTLLAGIGTQGASPAST